MAEEHETARLSVQLTECVEILLRPESSNEQRRQAHEQCESFKQNVQQCVAVGFFLYSKNSTDVMRHFGLRLVEDSVRLHWAEISTEDRKHIMSTTMGLIAKGPNSIPNESYFVKEAMSKIVVEIAKQEWPQRWPELLGDLTNASNLGAIQTEIVMMVLLRLSEECVSLETRLPSQRRREMSQELSLQSKPLFDFFMNTLTASTHSMKRLRSLADSSPAVVHQAELSERVSQSVLVTLAGFLEWVTPKHIYSDNCSLLQVLCLLLCEESLKSRACECLLQIVLRKGNLEQRSPLLVLFSEDAMSIMLSAAESAASRCDYDDQQYLFLKKLCQVLSTLGSLQLAQLWGSSTMCQRPPNFQQYLEAIFAFSKHSSQWVQHETNKVWLAFLKHPQISQDAMFKEFMPRLLELSRAHIIKVGEPNLSNHASCPFSKMDFNSYKEWHALFSSLRSESMDMVRHVTLYSPCQSLQSATSWLFEKIQECLQNTDQNGDINVTELLLVEWDGLVSYLDAVMSRLLKEQDQPQSFLQNTFLPHGGSVVSILEFSNIVIQAILNLEVKHDRLIYHVIGSLLAMSAFLDYLPLEVTTSIVKKIFYYLDVCTGGLPRMSWSKELISVRRLLCSSLVRLCSLHADLMKNIFSDLKAHTMALFSGDQMTTHDRMLLTEAVVCTCAAFKDFNTLSLFIGEILAPVQQMWTQEQFQKAFSCAEELILFLGLDKDPGDQTEEIGQNKWKLAVSLSTVVGCLRRCSFPPDEELVKGGFVQGEFSDGSLNVRSPASEHVFPLMGHIFSFLRALNTIWDSKYRNMIHPSFLKKSMVMHDVELNSIFGANPEAVKDVSDDFLMTGNGSVAVDVLKRMRYYLFNIQELGYILLGLCCETMSHEFYSNSTMADQLCSLVETFHSVPNFRMRGVTRQFVKSSIQCCPPLFYDVSMVPYLSSLFSYMLQHLTKEWMALKARQAGSQEEQLDDLDCDEISKEVIEDHLVHQVTRDLIDALILSCVSKKKIRGTRSSDEVESVNDDVKSGLYQDEAVMLEAEEEAGATSTQAAKGATSGFSEITSLGKRLLMTQASCHPLVILVFSGLCWEDTSAALKVLKIIVPIIKLILQDESTAQFTAQDFGQMFNQVLKGLGVHGSNPGGVEASLIKTGTYMYEMLRPKFPDVVSSVILQIPNTTAASLESLDNVILSTPPTTDKRKRDTFKKVVNDIIGKPVSEQFALPTRSFDLPPIKKPEKPKPESSVFETSAEVGLASLFDPANTGQQ